MYSRLNRTRSRSRTLLAVASFCAGLLFASGSHAALQSRLGGLALYDTDINVTWAANANINGQMTWAAANSWAAGVTIGGIGGWRLPTSDTSCLGFNCTGSEMGHLFYTELGGTPGGGSGFFASISGNATAAGFLNLQSNYYWSGTEYALNPISAWFFSTIEGVQAAGLKTAARYALAVYPGDVAAIPEPETYAMMLAGLGLMGFVARRRKRQR